MKSLPFFFAGLALVATVAAETPSSSRSCRDWLAERIPAGALTETLATKLATYRLRRAALSDVQMRAMEASGAPLTAATVDRFVEALELVASRPWESIDRANFAFRCMMAWGHGPAGRRAVTRAQPEMAACDDEFGVERGLVPEEEQGDEAMAAAAEIAALFRLPLDKPHRRVPALARWTKSPAHAAYLHELLSKGRLSGGAALLREVALRSPAFGRAYWHREWPGVPVTFGFEKESRSPKVARLYRPSEVRPDDWPERPGEEHLSELVRRAHVYRALARTTEAPRALGPFRLDAGTIPEMAHRHYAIDPDDFFASVRRVAALLGETDGFHVHVVFELPKGYAHSRRLGRWWLQANHFLVFRGLEEGLVPSGRVGIAERAEADALDTDRSAWLKMFSLGLRGGKFGPPLAAEAVRLSFELRDVTRDLDVLEADARHLAEAAVRRDWEKVAPEITLPALQLPRTPVGADDRAVVERLSALASPDSRKLVELALAPYETATYFDYRTGGVRGVSAAARRRIVLARARFRSDLEELVQTLENPAEVGAVSADLALHVLRWTLVEWARRARIAELYAGAWAGETSKR